MGEPHAEEISQGKRFEFGNNWKRFLCNLNDDRIAESENSFKEMLGITHFYGKRFIDVGSGSGLFSLAARRLGAKVHSFDYDPASVACTKELKNRYFAQDSQWTIEPGSILDRDYLSKLGKYDVVYSWGVLHHTGAMWDAFENILQLVDDGGLLFISIYNDNGKISERWRKIKRAYCRGGETKRLLILVLALLWIWGPALTRDLLFLRPWATIKGYDKSGRGMSLWSDLIDWVGGYPFEVAKPEDIFYFFKKRGFCLENLKTFIGGNGCNQFVFSLRNG